MLTYPAAPAVGSLVYVPGTSFSGRPSASVFAGLVGIVQSVQRDVRSGRVLSVGAHWFDSSWRRVANDVAPVRHLLPWSPGVGCGADCAPVVGFGSSCAGCGYRA